MGRLAGMVALISGGAQGLGEAQVRALAQEGASVVFGDLRETEARALQAALGEAGLTADFTPLDVTQEDSWAAAVENVMARHGHLDILVNNAGITLPKTSVETRSAEDWDRIMAVNAKGAFLGIKHAIPAMRRSGGGSIINISSLAAVGQAQLQEPAYAASKAAVTVLTKVVAAQHAHERIRCNSLHPGPIDSGMLRHTFAPDPAALARRLTRIPMERLGTLDEIVAGVVFLASDESSFMTGAELIIDGGASVQ